MNYFKKILLTLGALGATALPSYAQEKKDNFLDTARFVGTAEAFGAENHKRAAGNWKLLAGDDFGVYAQGQHAWQEQEFNDGSLEGTINRAGGGLYKYFPTSLDSALYTDVSLIYEDRDFEFTRDTDGAKFGFGNAAVNGVGKLGFVKLSDRTTFDEETPRFDSSDVKLLGTVAYGKGDMTGEMDGDYERILATAYARVRPHKDWFIQGGIGYKNEKLNSGDWTNNETSAELGIGNDAWTIAEIPVQWYVKGTHRHTETERNGVESAHNFPGFAAEFAIKPSHNVELGATLGHEADDGDAQGFGNYALIELKLKLGPSGQKKQ